MVVEKYRKMGVAKSKIRVLFEYGMEQAAIVGKENVFDFSIGNPSVPAPKRWPIRSASCWKWTPLPCTGTRPPAAALRPGKPLPPT